MENRIGPRLAGTGFTSRSSGYRAESGSHAGGTSPVGPKIAG